MCESGELGEPELRVFGRHELQAEVRQNRHAGNAGPEENLPDAGLALEVDLPFADFS